jgi:hypothetical protein
MGAAFTYTEMVSAHGLVHETRQTESYLDRDPAEDPFAVQIFAAEPDVPPGEPSAPWSSAPASSTSTWPAP